MATQLKPTLHFSSGDWHTSNFTIATNAERGRNSSHQVRQEARHLRNETQSLTKDDKGRVVMWDQHKNTIRLDNRCIDINDWKDRLEETRDMLNEEITRLKADKELCEKALAIKAVNLDTANQNLTTRDGRLKIDLVDDYVNNELRKEVQLIEGAKAGLQLKCSAAFEQLCRLEEAKQQVERDLEHKDEALDIDIEQTNLTENDPDICFHPNPTKTLKGSITPQEWDAHSRYNRARAEAEMKASKDLRENINHTIRRTSNDVEAQRKATDFAFRNRIQETKEAIDEDEFQKAKTEKEIAELMNDIAGIEQSIRDKDTSMKLAQTRLENRKCRPFMEQCRDNAQYGLVNQVHQIDATIEMLKDKLKQSQHSLTNLQNNLHRINEDLALKMNSLNLETDATNEREKLPSVNHDLTATTPIKLATIQAKEGLPA